MSLVVIRPGVQFRPDAAASFRRYEARIGRQADVNRTVVSYAEQDELYKLRQAGKYPYPVANPRVSDHVYRSDTDGGNAWDTDERGALLDEYGWVAEFPDVEPWHRVYHPARDQHRGEPAPAGTTTQEDDMYDDHKHAQVLTAARPIKLYKMGTGLVAVGAGGGFWIVPSDAYAQLLIAWEIAGPDIVARPIDQNELDTMRRILATVNPHGDGTAGERTDAVLTLTPEDVQRIVDAIPGPDAVADELANRLQS
ncbi:MAG: hypothetical protein BGN97_04460 [Microbacterium sp. 69-10]|uniref:hypothetical protein n=1 Tax=Microbacterium sp. 69-10 TaxID=1895783 RepID=UPI0009657E34|nr:hypothetical protein [Microbacterium sp. 69-10]OJU42014.1 MAG: hypothetical protein BGN97_04460 [Microbacterium sp. 69-10]